MKSKMNISNFYVFSEKLSGTTLQVHSVGLKLQGDQSEDDDITKLLMGEYNGIRFPIVFNQVYGKRRDDIIRTGTAILFLISDKFKTVLEQGQLTGWKTFPVQVLDKKGYEIKGYYGLSILGRCGPIEYEKSELIKKNLIPNGPLVTFSKGLYIGLEEWDGSDFFLPKGYFGIVVTERAAEALKKNKITNVRLENLSEIETIQF